MATLWPRPPPRKRIVDGIPSGGWERSRGNAYELSPDERRVVVASSASFVDGWLVDESDWGIRLAGACVRFDVKSIVMCYTASMRPGRTKTTSFSLDDVTLKNLRALAARRHKGNVSALLAEFAFREAKFAAAEAYFDKYGVPPLSAAAIARIEAEWQGPAPATKKRRRRAA